MRIDPGNQSPRTGDQAPISPSSRTRTTGADGARTAGLGPSGSVDLSPRAAQFLRIRPRLDAVSETGRKERVAQLKAQVAAGQYAVPGAEVADAMLRDDSVARMLGLGRPAR